MPASNPERMRFLSRTLVALLAAGAGAAFAADAPLPLLEVMARNARETNYHGIFTYEQGQQLRSARIVHAVVGGIEHARLQGLDGAVREFLRREHPLDCLHAGHRLLREGPDARALADNPGLAQYYSLEFDGAERIASREGRRLRISPRDPYRYGMNLVVDNSSSLLLKAETTDGAGRVLERFQFIELDVGGAAPADALSAGVADTRVEPRHSPPGAVPADAFEWSVSWLPAGFAESARERQRNAAGQAVETRMFTDGLAVFSVFVERHPDAGVSRAGQAVQGATIAYITPRPPAGLVTVVGEIPPETARLVANAVSFPAP